MSIMGLRIQLEMVLALPSAQTDVDKQLANFSKTVADANKAFATEANKFKQRQAHLTGGSPKKKPKGGEETLGEDGGQGL